jgi:hypothetical protein
VAMPQPSELHSNLIFDRTLDPERGMYVSGYEENRFLKNRENNSSRPHLPKSPFMEPPTFRGTASTRVAENVPVRFFDRLRLTAGWSLQTG